MYRGLYINAYISVSIEEESKRDGLIFCLAKRRECIFFQIEYLVDSSENIGMCHKDSARFVVIFVQN